MDRLKFESTIRKFDESNATDPHWEEFEGEKHKKELLYSQRMTRWLNNLYPDASEALQLAARAQHICRWEIPRSNYPKDRIGYLRWRSELKEFHADKAEEIMATNGYRPQIIDRVRFLLLKKQLRTDRETQALEDVVCLVFLQYYLLDFASKHTEEKVVSILQKTWKKMSTTGHKASEELTFPPGLEVLVKTAIQTVEQ